VFIIFCPVDHAATSFFPSMTSWKATDLADDKLPSLGADEQAREPRDIEAASIGDEASAPIEKVVSSRSKKSDVDLFSKEPPDGGLNAWLKVMGCFLIYSNIW
jgi:hypothetical protein